ncbi:MAG: zinc-ribbon domain-containing protein [Kangiellaceae bacterium]|nr:zinc-ribbon domain-containing protein [Kangiellaceae bacterium]
MVQDECKQRENNKVNTETLYTRCPTCDTAFKVTDQLLSAAGGKVRCGACLAIFQATDYMLKRAETKNLAPSVPVRPESEALNKSPETSSTDLAKSQNDSVTESLFDNEVGSSIPSDPNTLSQSSFEMGQGYETEPAFEPDPDQSPDIDLTTEYSMESDFDSKESSSAAEVPTELDSLDFESTREIQDPVAEQNLTQPDEQVESESADTDYGAESDTETHEDSGTDAVLEIDSEKNAVETLSPEDHPPKQIDHLAEFDHQNQSFDFDDKPSEFDEGFDENLEKQLERADKALDDSLLIADNSTNPDSLVTETEVQHSTTEVVEEDVQSNHELESYLADIVPSKEESFLLSATESIVADDLEGTPDTSENTYSESIHTTDEERDSNNSFDENYGFNEHEELDNDPEIPDDPDLDDLDLDESDFEEAEPEALEFENSTLEEQEFEEPMFDELEHEAFEEHEQSNDELSEQLSEQMLDTDSDPDPLDEFESIVDDSKSGIKSKLIFATIGILLFVLLQQLWSSRQSLAWSDTWGSSVKSVCQYLPCNLKARRDVTKIKLLQRQLSPDDEQENLLDIKVLLINEAAFEQPYPTIKIAFSNKDGKQVSLKLFKPEDYLEADSLNSLMPMNSEVHIHFKTELTHPDALGFEFIFE